MFGTVFDKATGFLDQRFVLNLLLPSLTFWGSLGLLTAQGQGWAPMAGWWSERTASEQVLLIVGAVTGLTLFGYVIGGHVTALTRLWEGYWPSRLNRLATRRTEEHRRRWDNLDNSQVGYMRRFYYYPVRKADALPTQLGNVLRAAEDYPRDEERYGLDAVFFWPRLYLILPQDTRSQVDDFRSGMDRMVLVASLAVAFPIVGMAAVLIAETAPWVWVIASAGALLIAALAYQGAVSAAVAYGDVVRTCFDLYRRPLLQQFGLVPPTSIEAERALWGALQEQLYRRGTEHPDLLKWASADDGK